MDIPVYIDGKNTGTVTITERNGEVIASASLDDPGRIVRLTLYGEGEAYLGIPEPKHGRLFLEKRFSGAALRVFPQKPAYAAECRKEKSNPKTHVVWHGGKPHYF